MGKDFNTANKKGIEIDRIKLTRRRKRILRELGLGEDLKSAEIAEELKLQVKANNALSKANKGLSKTIKAKDRELKTMVSYLSTYQNVPFKKMTDILENLFGLHMSQGSVANILNGMRKL